MKNYFKIAVNRFAKERARPGETWQFQFERLVRDLVGNDHDREQEVWDEVATRAFDTGACGDWMDSFKSKAMLVSVLKKR